jgi:hypothetical protein
MSKLKQLQLEIAHLIENPRDQEELIRIFFEIKTGGANAMLRNKTAQTIIDLKSVYGIKLHEAINILLNPTYKEQDQTQNNLTSRKDVPTDNHEKECGK